MLANGKQFGLLDKCNHIFCLKCIRSWRATYDKRTTKHHFRTCPICRERSDFVIPSYYFVKDGAEKDEIIEGYRGALGEIPCRLFNRGKGECPFKNSCFYAHIDMDGNYFEYDWNDEMAANVDGIITTNEIEPTLAQRMGLID